MTGSTFVMLQRSPCNLHRPIGGLCTRPTLFPGAQLALLDYGPCIRPVEGTPEPDCSLRFSGRPDSFGNQLCPPPGMQLAHQRLSLYTGMTPQPGRQLSGLVRRVSARARACVQTPLTHHAPIADQVRQPKLLIRLSAALLPTIPSQRHDLGESAPVSEITPENAHREPPAPVPTRPSARCPPPSSGVAHRHPPRHTPPHPIGDFALSTPPGPDFRFTRSDVAGLWHHSPILPTCISATFAPTG